MTTVFGVPLPAILGQLMLGLVNGSFYALLSLGLAVIFGLLGVVNFAHGAFYMLGAFAAYIGLQAFGVNYWWALLLAPLAVGLLGILIERLFLRHLYQLDPLVWAAPDVRHRADRRGNHARPVRRFRQFLPGAGIIAGRVRLGVHGAAHLSGLGGPGFAHGVRHDLVV